MRTISNVPFVKEVRAETEKAIRAVKNADYPGFYAFFVYTNIVIYFAWAVHKIYF